ncbi:hypothetical protein QE152_g996 [Popillia japonica]|uniref:Transposase Tc1-like domain-containing protein n=1 Tax=Popillia japonica TaxID=7064 RepID=A0AAW1N431_POPJA
MSIQGRRESQLQQMVVSYNKLISKRNRCKTASEIATKFNHERRHPVSVKRRLVQGNLHGRVVARKPLLRCGNRMEKQGEFRNTGIGLWCSVKKNYGVEKSIKHLTRHSTSKKKLWSEKSILSVC